MCRLITYTYAWESAVSVLILGCMNFNSEHTNASRTNAETINSPLITVCIRQDEIPAFVLVVLLSSVSLLLDWS